MAAKTINFYGRMVTTKQYNQILRESTIHHLRQAIKYLQGKRDKPKNRYPEVISKATVAVNGL
jgi:hypothetical protein